jgi:hypothetical protein
LHDVILCEDVLGLLIRDEGCQIHEILQLVQFEIDLGSSEIHFCHSQSSSRLQT